MTLGECCTLPQKCEKDEKQIEIKDEQNKRRGPPDHQPGRQPIKKEGMQKSVPIEVVGVQAAYPKITV